MAKPRGLNGLLVTPRSSIALSLWHPFPRWHVVREDASAQPLRALVRIYYRGVRSADPADCTILTAHGWHAARLRNQGVLDWRTPISATAERPVANDEGEFRCYRHPNVTTRLRCNRCNRPICTQCATATSVGLRCPECARGPQPVMYQTDTTILARAAGAGGAAALLIGVVWGLLNTAGLGRYGAVYDWGFWFTLLLGFGVAESISYLAKRRRGSTMQAIGIAAVLLGFVVSRIVMNARLPRPVLIDDIISQTPGVSQVLHINLLTLIFLALACAIVWRRFR